MVNWALTGVNECDSNRSGGGLSGKKRGARDSRSNLGQGTGDPRGAYEFVTGRVSAAASRERGPAISSSNGRLRLERTGRRAGLEISRRLKGMRQPFGLGCF